jgi:hypothetical protein
MDELDLDLVRELLPAQPPPAPEFTAAVRARLGHQRPRPSHQPRLTRVGLPVAAVAGVAAVAAVIGLTASATQTPAITHQWPSGAGTTGRQVLLTAAQFVGSARPAAPSGRWWDIPGVVGNVIPVGTGHDRYLILEKTVNDQFLARSPQAKAGSPQIVQQLGVGFPEPADVAAWHRAGSPTSWKADQEFGLDSPQGPSASELYGITTGRGSRFVLDASFGSKPFLVGNRFLSERQLRQLPASPAQLKKLLAGGISGWPGGVSSYLFQITPTVLDMPVTPAVRSALYRMLAALPGVHSSGLVRDAAGQRGPAVTLNGRYKDCGAYTTPRFVRTRGGGTVKSYSLAYYGKRVRVVKPIFGRWVGGGPMFASCVVQQRLILNPATGLPMAQDLRYLSLPQGARWPAPAGLFSYQLLGTPHWVQDLPATDPHGH